MMVTMAPFSLGSALSRCQASPPPPRPCLAAGGAPWGLTNASASRESSWATPFGHTALVGRDQGHYLGPRTWVALGMSW